MCLRSKNTQSAANIRKICRQNRLSPTVVMWKSKKILDRYRDAKLSKKRDGDYETAFVQRLKEEVNEKRRLYSEGKGAQTNSLDHDIMAAWGTSWADDMIHTIYAQMENYQVDYEDYKSILNMSYFSALDPDDNFIMDKLHLSRATYYRRKKEAIVLFGILLWNNILDMCEAKENVS